MASLRDISLTKVFESLRDSNNILEINDMVLYRHNERWSQRYQSCF